MSLEPCAPADTRVCVQYGFIYAFMGPCRYIKLVPFPTYVLTPCVYRNKIIDNIAIIAIIAAAPSQWPLGVDCSCYSFIIAGIFLDLFGENKEFLEILSIFETVGDFLGPEAPNEGLGMDSL